MVHSFKLTEEDFNKINEDAENFRQEYKESGFQTGVPVSYLNDGAYVFRIYPDRDANGFVRLIKRVWIHTLTVDEKKLRFWKDDRVNKLFEEAKEAGMEKIWGKPLYQFKSSDQGYMMAHFFESSDEKYTKVNQTYATVLNKRQMFAIFDFIADMHPEDKRMMLDPSHPASAIKIQITRGSGKANVSCGIASFQKLALPDLEFKDDDGKVIEYTGLDSVYITEDDKISDEDFFKLRTGVYSEIANFKAMGGKAKEKGAEGHKFGDKAAENPPLEGRGYSTGPTQAFQASQAGNLNPELQQPTSTPNASAASPGASQASQAVVPVSGQEITCRLADQCRINPKMAEAYPDAKFGNKPNKMTPYCFACSYEQECMIATEKAKKAA